MTDTTALTDQIHDMTSAEIYALIFGDANPAEHVAMPLEVAESVVDHPAYHSLDFNLRDWAFSTLDATTTI